MAIKDQYFTVSEAAKITGVTRQTMSRWIADGKISAEKVGREVLIEKDELSRYLVEQRTTEFASQIVNDITDRIRKKYNYSELDIVRLNEFDQRNTFNFSVLREDGTFEIVSVRIRKAEPLINKSKNYLVFGFKVKIEKIEREIYEEDK